MPFSIVRASAIVSPDDHYAIVVPGEADASHDSPNCMLVVDGKTLAVQGT